MGKYTEPHLRTSALISIDTQNDFTLAGAPARIEGTSEVIPNMVRLLESFRRADRPIIHVVRIYLPDGSNVDACRRESVESGRVMLKPDSPGVQLVDALKPNASVRLDTQLLLSGAFQSIGRNEFILYKPRWGSFYQTGLQGFLEARQIDTLVICGCNYPNCPRTTIYEASERDLRILLVKDAISQLYAKGEEEMRRIQVELSNTDDVITQMSAFGSMGASGL